MEKLCPHASSDDAIYFGWMNEEKDSESVNEKKIFRKCHGERVNTEMSTFIKFNSNRF